MPTQETTDTKNIEVDGHFIEVPIETPDPVLVKIGSRERPVQPRLAEAIKQLAAIMEPLNRVERATLGAAVYELCGAPEEFVDETLDRAAGTGIILG